MALSTDRNTLARSTPIANAYLVAATTTIYNGALVAVNAAGYLVPAADTAGLKVVGRAREKVDNSAGSNGAKACLVDEGIFKWANSAGAAVVQASVGDIVFVEDDQTVALTGGTNSVVAGRCMHLESDGVWVYCGTATSSAAAAAVAGSGIFISSEQTGNGSSQNVAHTLGVTPSKVFVSVTELPDAGAEAGFDVAQGAHTSTNVVVTVTNNVKYTVLAIV